MSGIVVTASTNPVYSASLQKGAGAVGGGAIGAGAIGGSGAAGGGAYGRAARTVTLGVAMPAHERAGPQSDRKFGASRDYLPALVWLSQPKPGGVEGRGRSQKLLLYANTRPNNNGWTSQE